jgi:hypothetical protein
MSILDAFQILAIWIVNGALAGLFLALDHAFALAALGGLLLLARGAPQEQLPYFSAFGGLAALAAFILPPPGPALLAAMAWAGAIAVRLERFAPQALRWRAFAGLSLYALAGLGYAAYAAYIGGINPQAWGALVGEGEASTVLAQGRSFLHTLAAWGLWVILPLGYFGLLAQALLVHPPLPARPDELIHAIRARGEREALGPERSMGRGRGQA